MKPLILDYAVERKGEINTVYKYDFAESLNVITVKNEKKIFIDTTSKDLSLLTQTRVVCESDDNDYNMLELCTKTKVAQEREDNYNYLLELTTKTLTQQERDDESFSNFQ